MQIVGWVETGLSGPVEAHQLISSLLWLPLTCGRSVEKLLQSRMLLGELAQLVLDVLVIVAAIDLPHVDSLESNRQLLMPGFRVSQRHQKNRSFPQFKLFPVNLDCLI